MTKDKDSRIAALEAKLAALTGPAGDMRDYHEGIVAALMSRAEAAETKLTAERAAHAEARKALLIECLDILNSLIDNIKRHGNYSPESTCAYIDQAGSCIREALSPAPEAQQEPVAWRWKPKDSATWIYNPKPEWLEAQSRDEIDAEPLYTRPAEQAVTEAMELARAVLAQVMTAGHNVPGPTPEDVEKAFWALDDALKAAMEAKE